MGLGFDKPSLFPLLLIVVAESGSFKVSLLTGELLVIRFDERLCDTLVGRLVFTPLIDVLCLKLASFLQFSA